MKKIVSVLLLLAIAACSVFGLVSCGGDDGIPDGMQLARGGKTLGYKMYIPAHWKVSNGNLGSESYTSGGYVSSSLAISAYYTETAMPDGYEDYIADKDENEDVSEDGLPTEGEPEVAPAFIQAYFEKEILNSDTERGEVNVITNGVECDFGNADEAYMYVFAFDYDKAGQKESVAVKVMQIYTIYKGRFGIFQYMADADHYEEYYNGTKDRKGVTSILKHFKYQTKMSGQNEPTYRDPDKFYLISDKTKNGFELYVTGDFAKDYSTTAVSATKANGINVNVSKVTINIGIQSFEQMEKQDVIDYWDLKQEGLEENSDKWTNLKGESNTTLNIIREREFTKNTCRFEYTYVINGDLYHVYQVFCQNSSFLSQAQYVYTYTVMTPNGEFEYTSDAEGNTVINGDRWTEDNLAEAKKIFGKIEF